MAKIIVDRGVKAKIAKTLGVSPPTVDKALLGGDTVKADEIRELAIKMGGIKI